MSLIANAYGALLKLPHCSPLLKRRFVDSLMINGGCLIILFLNFNIFWFFCFLKFYFYGHSNSYCREMLMLKLVLHSCRLLFGECFAYFYLKEILIVILFLKENVSFIFKKEIHTIIVLKKFAFLGVAQCCIECNLIFQNDTICVENHIVKYTYGLFNME